MVPRAKSVIYLGFLLRFLLLLPTFAG